MASYKLSDVVYEEGAYWVLAVVKYKGSSRYVTGFDVYKTGITHSTRVAQIGYIGEVGLAKARAEVARRLAIERDKGDV